ncbi:hypothetical protein [Lentzea sp. NPDC051838]|uniref:hypothetical protein n=1 Tax=Lentzea sp. NPDC051838 TaxID=3154849 RepID=UPI003439416C
MKLVARAIVGILAAALATTVATTPAQAVPGSYHVQLLTCDVEDSGTDDRIEARLNGTISSPWLLLDEDAHESDLRHSYSASVTMPYLGPIKSVDLSVDYHGDHICVEAVIVRGPDGVTVHPHHNWVRWRYSKAFPLRLQAA